MTRFGDDCEEYFPNQGELWHAHTLRALGGKRGQAALRDLEAALLALPEPRLISGHLALNGQLCAVGALALKRKVDAGCERAAVLAELETAIPVACASCWHSERDHDADGACRVCPRRLRERGEYSFACTGFVPDLDSDYEGDAADITARLGTSIGLTYTLAWHLAYVNDEYRPGGETPEERYDRVLAWTRKVIQPEAVTA